MHAIEKMLKIRDIIFFLAIILCLSNTVLFAADANDILGLWLSEAHDGRIRIYRCGEEYCGDIVWSRNAPEFDVNNPDADLRNRRTIGLNIMHGFRYAGDDEWKGGEVYDPQSGHTYKGRMKLVSHDILDLHGYVLIPLFGRSSTWTRIKEDK